MIRITMRRFLRGFFKVVTAAAAVFVLTAAAISISGLREDPRPADVAVVFGSKVEVNGVPAPTLQTRLDRAAEVYHAGLVKAVLVSGGLGKEGHDEAQVMADDLAAQGVPREVIVIDRQGNNTLLTAQHTRALAETYGWRSFLLVSNFYHLPRARLTFTRLGLEPVFTTYARLFQPNDFYYALPREVLAYPAYGVRNMR
jgi:vancomycin permeability regulator SanA